VFPFREVEAAGAVASVEATPPSSEPSVIWRFAARRASLFQS